MAVVAVARFNQVDEAAVLYCTSYDTAPDAADQDRVAEVLDKLEVVSPAGAEQVVAEQATAQAAEFTRLVRCV